MPTEDATAIPLLIDGKPHRARRILEHLSDPTTDPIPAAPTKAATGAPAPELSLKPHTPDRDA